MDTFIRFFRGNGQFGSRLITLMAIDLFCIWAALILAFAIRYEALISVWPYLRWGSAYFVMAPLVQIPIYYIFGLYNRIWRYASTREMARILLAGAMSSAILFVLNFLILQPLHGPWVNSRSIWLLEGVLSTCFVAGVRFLLRLLQERRRVTVVLPLGRGNLPNSMPMQVLIVGAGDAGSMILREIQANPSLGMRVIGLIDDDPTKRHMRMHGVSVLGDRNDIPVIAAKHRVDEAIIAMPTAPGKELRNIIRVCDSVGIPQRTIPAIYSLLGNVDLSHLRKIEIEDLLRREPIQTDTSTVSELLRGRRVLVTGGGGSIGSELCRQILRCQPAELILLGHGENSIFEIHNELKREAGRMGEAAPRLRPVIADVRFADRICRLFLELQPHIVFHAAAHKHVPLMEENPAEAITNNVLGTRNVVNASLAAGVERFVMISTDKAVNPTSVMGASKRAAELVVHEAAIASKKPFLAVRFGNVLGSRGSVVLTFKQQIAAGGPVTVTHPDMKRYFMTIPEAVQLVLQGAALSQGGEVFMLDMGEPVKIVDLAHDLIALSGLEVGRDIDVVYTGLRPGEKLFEEMFAAGEQYERTQHQKIYIASNASSFVPDGLERSIGVLEQAAVENDRGTIVRALQNLIPEYCPPAPNGLSVDSSQSVGAKDWRPYSAQVTSPSAV
ncbi:MAG: nucleoside-diphosphate sugar epimerase/dehydratase [Caldilineaceae bacterium]